jgi:D-sedoheptulose 7-phosphate isomerase
MYNTIKRSMEQAHQTLTDFMASLDNMVEIERISKALARCFQDGGKCIIFGNGGSMCDANHFAEEFTGRFRNERPALPCIAISEPSHLTCVGNDYGFEAVFSRGVEAFARPDDFVIGISTSGNSPNVVRALHKAQDLGCFTFALLGKDGGLLKDSCDYELIVPASTADRVQEVHTLILHIIIECVENELFPEM